MILILISIDLLYSLEPWLGVICLFFIINLWRGKIAPKPTFLTLLLLGGSFWWLQTQKAAPNKTPTKQPFIATDSINESSSANKKITTTTLLPNPPKPKKLKKEVPKFITKVKIEGISSELFNKKFTEKAGYTIAKKGDYTLTFAHTGNIKRGGINDESRHIYSGGNLVVNVGQNRCCCGNLISIPKGIPLGKSIKEGNQILDEKIEEYALKNIDIIVEMVSECLPKI